MSAPLIELSGLACGYGRRQVLGGIDFAMVPGEFVCLLGPNGVGKTTLFKTILRLQPPLAGTVRLLGEDVARWSMKRFAGLVGYVPQAHSVPFPFPVLDVVAMGRAPALGLFEAPSAQDRALAMDMLDTLSIGHLAHAPYTRISGGERQLALIARALAQQPRLLVMDEPTSNLDYGHQIEVLGHVGRLSAQTGIGVILTTHDPNAALRHASRVLAIDRQGAMRSGVPAQVITQDWLQETYRIPSQVVPVTLRNHRQELVCLPLLPPATEREPS